MGNDGAYVGFDMFREYFNIGSITTKQILTHIIDRLLQDKTVKTNLPASGVVTVTNQNDRRIVHLLYADLVKRGRSTEVIEDLIPLYNIEVSVAFDKEPKRVYLAPQEKDIDFEVKDGYVHFKVNFSPSLGAPMNQPEAVSMKRVVSSAFSFSYIFALSNWPQPSLKMVQ